MASYLNDRVWHALKANLAPRLVDMIGIDFGMDKVIPLGGFRDLLSERV
jgi:hypothetical protein